MGVIETIQGLVDDGFNTGAESKPLSPEEKAHRELIASKKAPRPGRTNHDRSLLQVSKKQFRASFQKRGR